MKPSGPGDLWAIVLAAGEGTRLSGVTRAVHGREVPKQFATLGWDRTFVQRTLDRIAPLVSAARTVVVVAEHQAPLAEAQLGGYAGIEIVRQPANRGTGAGLLLPLAHVLARDPAARVLVLPSDHDVQREPEFILALERAVAAADRSSSGVALVGASAEGPAEDLGWIVPGPVSWGAARNVERFVEKPRGAAALALLRAGGLWNTLILAARGQALWRLCVRHLPALAPAFERYRAVVGQPETAAVLRTVYDEISSADLSREVLERAHGLVVVTMADTGWSDCGTPERLMQALSRSDRGGFRRLSAHLLNGTSDYTGTAAAASA